MVAHILQYRYDAQMRWAVAGTYPNEAKAANARKRFAAFMRPGTEFISTPTKQEPRRSDSNTDRD